MCQIKNQSSNKWKSSVNPPQNMPLPEAVSLPILS
jgi:hypothetical protein